MLPRLGNDRNRSTTAAYAAATTQGPKQASRASTGPRNQQQKRTQKQNGVLTGTGVIGVVATVARLQSSWR